MQSEPKGEAGLRDNPIGQDHGSKGKSFTKKEIAMATFNINRNRD